MQLQVVIQSDSGTDGWAGASVETRYLLQDIFARRYDGLDDHGMNISELVPTGALPRALPQLHERGVDLPPGCYAAARRAPADPSSY